MSEQGLEISFPATFAIVNAAVAHTMDRWKLRQGDTLPCDERQGFARYSFMLYGGDTLLLYVLDSGAVSTISIHGFVRADGTNAVALPADQQLINLLSQIMVNIQTAIRRTQPDYTLRPLVLGPPCPPLSEGWPAIFSWQDRFARALTNDELGALIGTTGQAVANARTRHGSPRTVRGRPKKSK